MSKLIHLFFNYQPGLVSLDLTQNICEGRGCHVNILTNKRLKDISKWKTESNSKNEKTEIKDLTKQLIIYLTTLDWKIYNQQLTYSNGKLQCKEDLTYKQLENLIKEASRKLNKRNIFRLCPTSSFNNNTM